LTGQAFLHPRLQFTQGNATLGVPLKILHPRIKHGGLFGGQFLIVKSDSKSHQFLSLGKRQSRNVVENFGEAHVLGISCAGDKFNLHGFSVSVRGAIVGHFSGRSFMENFLAARMAYVQNRVVTDGSASHSPTPHQRRPRYAGRNPRKFEDKYKERDPQRHPDTVEKVIASGKTPAGTHRPILVAEILEVLAPLPGKVAVDCTLGYGGHAQEILKRIQPGGRLIGLDADPLELPKTEARLRALGFGPETFHAHRSNFAGLPAILAGHNIAGADLILADLGVSSMQIDDPARGFSVKHEGPLDMRLNPQRGQSASALLKRLKPDALSELLTENADEPRAAELSAALAGQWFATTIALAEAIRAASPRLKKDDADLTVRRVFQALRIAVNDEFSALDMLLRMLPGCLSPRGRVAILTFHSGEDRRVKKSFEAGLRDEVYSQISREVIRPSSEEQRSNSRSTPAKLRWALRK
jgi:16S rRNA (cytosine1402-N4)-methyltransferase